MPFCGTRTPPRGPVVTQTAIALLRGFVGSKKSDLHLLALQHLGNERGHTHVACVKGEVKRFVTSRSSMRPTDDAEAQTERCFVNVLKTIHACHGLGLLA